MCCCTSAALGAELADSLHQTGTPRATTGLIRQDRYLTDGFTSTSHVRLSEASQPGDRGVDPLVGGGQRDPDVPDAGGPVEFARRDQDAQLGQPLHGRPAVQAGMDGPQVQPGLRVDDGPARRLQAGRSRARRAAYLARCSAACSSSDSAAAMAACTGRGHDHARRACGLSSSSAIRCRVAGDEPGPVTGQVGALGQRVHREQAVVRAPADVRVQHRQRGWPPSPARCSTRPRRRRCRVPGPS